jgi:flagellar basal body-associated protein FliL
MQETYEPEPHAQAEYYPPQPKKKMSGWLIALIVVLVLIVVCCLCVFVSLLLLGPAIGNTFSTIIEDLATFTPMP